MAFQALEVPYTLIAGRTSNADEVALLTQAGSLGRTLDSYVASVCAYWDSQGPRVLEAWRQLLGSQGDFLSAIALMAQAVGSTDPALQQLYVRIAECQSMLQQLARLLRTHALMNASMASELSGSPLCAHLARNKTFLAWCEGMLAERVSQMASSCGRAHPEPFAQVLCALDADPHLCIPSQLQAQQPQTASPPQPCSLWRSTSPSCVAAHDAAFRHQQMLPAAMSPAQRGSLSIQPSEACCGPAGSHAVLQPSRVQMATIARSPPVSWPAKKSFSDAPQSRAASCMQHQQQLQHHIQQPAVQDGPVRSIAPSLIVPSPVAAAHAGSTTSQDRPQGAGQPSRVLCRGVLQADSAGLGGKPLRTLQQHEPLGEGERCPACSPRSGGSPQHSRQQQEGSRRGVPESVSAGDPGGTLLRGRPQDEAARVGVLQSGSSEDLAKALANLTQMVSCARSEKGQHGAPGSACLPAVANQDQLLRLPTSYGQQTAPLSSCTGAATQHRPSLPSLVFQQQTAQLEQADVGVPASGSTSLSLPHNLAAQPGTDTCRYQSDPPSLTAAQPASQADRQSHLTSCRVGPIPLPCGLSGADMQAPVPAKMPATSQPTQPGSEHSLKRKWTGSDTGEGLQESQDPGDAQLNLQPAAKRGRPGRSPFQIEHEQQLLTQLAWPACAQDAVQTLPQAATSIAAGQDMQLDLQSAAGVKSLHAILRGDAAPSTSIERSKALSDGAHPGQHAAQQAKQSSALLAPPFAFQQTTPDPHRTQAEQLTPMLHLEQHMPTTDGMPRDAAHPEAASMQAPLPVHCMPDTACLPRPVQGDEQLRSAQVQIKPLPLTLSKETPAADAVGTLGRGCPHHASQSSQQRRVAGSPGMGSKSSSHYKSSRSSSEECRGSRCEADVAAGIVRSATCPPQLALESQRGSNSPKKTGLGRFSRQDAALAGADPEAGPELKAVEGSSQQATPQTQPSPLQRSHLRMSSQPERADQHMGGKPQGAASWTALSGSSQHVSSGHSMKEQALKGDHATAQAASQGPVESAAGLDKPSPAEDVLVPAAVQLGSQPAARAAELEEHMMIAGRSPGKGLGEMVQTCAERQQLREAMQLLHSVACQISEHKNAPLQHMQRSQLRQRSRQPSQGSQPQAVVHACGLTINEPCSQLLLAAAALPQSQPERQAAQPSSAAGSAQQAGCRDASQGKQGPHFSSGDDPRDRSQRLLTPGTQANASQEQSDPLQLFQGSPALTDNQTTNNSSIDVGGPEDIPGVGLRLHCLTPGGQANLPGQSPAMERSAAASGEPGSATANGPGHASRGNQDQPEPSQQMPGRQQSSVDPHRQHSSTSTEKPEHVSTYMDRPQHGSEVTQEHAAPLEQMPASKLDATDAQRNSGSTGMGNSGHVSTGREDPGEHDSKDTQDTQVEGEGACEGQAELKLSFQLSSEDQELALGQEQAASEQLMSFDQPPAGQGQSQDTPAMLHTRLPRQRRHHHSPWGTPFPRPLLQPYSQGRPCLETDAQQQGPVGKMSGTPAPVQRCTANVLSLSGEPTCNAEAALSQLHPHARPHGQDRMSARCPIVEEPVKALMTAAGTPCQQTGEATVEQAIETRQRPALTQAQQGTVEEQDWGDEPLGAAPNHERGAVVMGLALGGERCAAAAVDRELLPNLLLPTPSPSQ